MDAPVAHQFPLFILCISDYPSIISPAFVPGCSSKIVRERLCGLFTGDAGHFYLDTETLIFQTNHAAASFRSSPSMM
jgi:hypothetical protein